MVQHYNFIVATTDFLNFFSFSNNRRPVRHSQSKLQISCSSFIKFFLFILYTCNIFLLLCHRQNENTTCGSYNCIIISNNNAKTQSRCLAENNIILEFTLPSHLRLWFWIFLFFNTFACSYSCSITLNTYTLEYHHRQLPQKIFLFASSCCLDFAENKKDIYVYVWEMCYAIRVNASFLIVSFSCMFRLFFVVVILSLEVPCSRPDQIPPRWLLEYQKNIEIKILATSIL